MTDSVMIDGYNLGLEQGTGVATYARNLSHIVHELGHRVDVLYGFRMPRMKDAFLQEAYFFNPPPQRPSGTTALALHRVAQVVRPPMPATAYEIPLSGRVVSRAFKSRLPYYDRIWNSSDLFG